MRLASTVLLLACASVSALELEVLPRFNGAPLVYDAVTNMTAAGQEVSITRLDFLLSDFALRRDGQWIALSNQFVFVSGREGRTRFTLADVPAETFDRIRFNVGLPPELNHADPAQYASDHPLNPQVNGLHWSWAGGYVFLALEGRWLRADGALSGYSYHVATDPQLITVELEIPKGNDLGLVLNVDRIFAGALDDKTDTSHSRTNDALVAQLRANIENAFEVITDRRVAHRAAATATNNLQVAGTATPYRFTYSRFFPQPSLPVDNPLTEQGVELGRRLFFDPRLSVNGAQSCASCHEPTRGFTQDRTVSAGAEGRAGKRNAMGLFNLAWKSSYFWDGRAATLREQVVQPIQNPDEMHETMTNVAAKLSGDSEYRAQFAEAFGTDAVTADRAARALEQYLFTQISCGAKFDRVLKGEEKFTDEEQRGFELFHTEYDPSRGQYGADCFHCHGGPLFQSQNFANNGLDTEFVDAGRSEVTRRDGDRGKFAVPSLRNVALTAPYMHDGRFATLTESLEHYCTGTKRSATLDPNLAKHPDGGVPLSEMDKKAMLAFLETLTDQSKFYSQP